MELEFFWLVVLCSNTEWVIWLSVSIITYFNIKHNMATACLLFLWVHLTQLGYCVPHFVNFKIHLHGVTCVILIKKHSQFDNNIIIFH